MAAQEYYLGTQAAQELQGSHPPNPYQSQPPKLPQYQQQLGTPSYANTPPPSYSAQPQGPPPPPNKQFHGYLPHQAYPEKPPQAQAATAPYPQTPPAGYYPFSQPMPQPQRQPSNYLGVPLQQQRSHSQPPRVHFADDDSDRSTSLGSISDDEYSPRRHHHHHHRHHHHSNSSSHRHGSRSRRDERAYDSSDSSDRDRDRDRTSSSSRHRHHKPHRSHSYEEVHKDSSKTLDTFLGAGAGTIIGDVIFPGLGTAAGLVLGGYGGRKYAQDKLRSSHEGSDSGGKTKKRHHGGSRRAGDDGWDEKTRTYRKGAAVR